MKRVTRSSKPWTEKVATATWVLVFLAAFIIAAELIGWMIAVTTTLVLLCSYLLSRKTSAPFNLGRMSISSFWYATYLAMIFFPAFFVFADEQGPARVRFLFAVESVLVTVPLGALCASRILSFRAQEADRYFQSPLLSPQAPGSMGRPFVFLLGIAVLVTALYLREVGTIPLFYIFSNPGDNEGAASLREESFKLLASTSEYVYFLARGTLYPFLAMVSFGCYLWTKNRKWLALFLATLAAGIFFASLSLAKKPVATIFLVLGLFTYFFRGRSISFRQAVAFFCLVFLFPVIVIVSIYAGAGLGPLEVSQFIANRLFYGPSEVVYYYFEAFPGNVGYLYGRSIGKLSWILGLQYFNTANYVGRYAWPEQIESIQANGAFISDLDADFGLPGVVLGGVVAGAVMQMIHILLVRRRKTIIGLACYAFMVYEFWDLNSTSLHTLLASNGTLLALALFWLLEKWVYPQGAAIRKVSELNRAPDPI